MIWEDVTLEDRCFHNYMISSLLVPLHYDTYDNSDVV